MTQSIRPVVDPPSPFEGMTFESQSSYKLIRKLGSGGMGEVWLAERISAGNHSQRVAVKYLFDAHAGKQLAAEALRMSHLNHDNIVPFVDSGRDFGGRYFIAMSYINGIDLDDLMAVAKQGEKSEASGSAPVHIPEKILGFIAFMVLRGLGHAHEYQFEDGSRGLIHMDISPGNILIDESKGFVKITDFGVAAQQSTQKARIEITGKVPYMAPEVLTESAADARADIYSLGIVLYELLTGFNPNLLTSKTVNIIGAVTNVMLAIEKPMRPPSDVVLDVDPTFSKIIMKMAASDPDDRYPGAEEVIADLARYLYASGVGPNSASLVSYLKLLRNPDVTPDRRDKNALPFLFFKNGLPDICPERRLSLAAQQDLAESRTPGRKWQ
jgi:eukaryotic-like serine/threonine-protein kinase